MWLLGLVAPLLLSVQMILQRVSKKQLDWNGISENLYVADWQKWLKRMEIVKGLQTRECKTSIIHSPIRFDLSVYTDAYGVEYVDVPYCRWLINSENYEWKLLFAESIVASLKSAMIPRLQLNAASFAREV